MSDPLPALLPAPDLSGDAIIVSASRRTDIPAFYADWLLARVEAGWAASVNPFNRRAARVSLAPRDVRAIVLWTKDLSRFDEPARRLIEAGHRLVFQLTVTGLPSALEPGVPPPAVTVPAAHRLAAMLGPEAVLWRYDPILLGGALDAAWHRARFAELATRMAGATTACVVSFGTYYRKVQRNLALAPAPAAQLRPADADEIRSLSLSLAEEAARHGISMQACCTPEAEIGTITRAACVDARLIERLYPGAGRGVRRAPSRPGCGCFASRDIGLYDSCPHACVYCYANAAPERARQHFAQRTPLGPTLYGELIEREDGSLVWRP